MLDMAATRAMASRNPVERDTSPKQQGEVSPHGLVWAASHPMRTVEVEARVLGALHLVDHYHATPHERKLGFTHRECLVSGGHTAGGREHPDTKERRACWAITRTSV